MTKPVTLLVVDDDDIDFEMVEFAFKRAKIANPILRAVDGVDALDVLYGRNGREPIARPYIILLDINMPRMGGVEFLEELRSSEEFSESIVFVFTTSDAEKDIADAYAKNVAGYMVKSRIGEDFMKLVGMLDLYWRVVELPVDDNQGYIRRL